MKSNRLTWWQLSFKKGTIPTSGRCDPGKTQRSSCEVSVGEDVGQAELLVVGLGVQVEEVWDVDVGDAERVGLADVAAGRVVVDFDALDLEMRGTVCRCLLSKTNMKFKLPNTLVKQLYQC